MNAKSAITGLVVVILLSSALLGQASALNEGDYFRGKTVTYIVSSKPGGGYDIYARLIAVYMEKYLPGTKIRVKNVPGAGGLVAVNRLNVSAADGLTIGTFNTGVVYSQLLQSDGVNFDLRNLSWIGKAARTTRVLVLSARSGFKSLTQLRESSEPALFSAAGVGSSAYIETQLVTRLLQINSRIVPGFSGNESQLSMMRGEIDAAIASQTGIWDFTQNGHGRVLLIVGGDGTGLPDIPVARELVDTPQAAHAFQLIDTIAELGRLTAAPPGVPAARLEVLRGAYQRALQDAEFLARAAALHLHIAPAFGDVVAFELEEVLGDPGYRQAARSLLLGDKAGPGK